MSLYLDGTLGLSASAGSAVLNNTGNNTVLTAQSLSASTVTASTSIGIGIGTSTPTTALQVNGVVTMGDASQFMTAASFGMRNRIINGNMQIWQRGTSYALTNSFVYGCADRWETDMGSTAAATASQSTSVPITAGQLFQYSLKLQRTAASTSTGNIVAAQALETANSYDLAGSIITLSWWAKCGTTYSQSGSQLTAFLFFGQGTDQSMTNMRNNAWTGQTNTAVAVTLTTSWQRFSFSYLVPSTTTQLGMQFVFTPSGTAGADDSFYVTGVQMEFGTAASPFERRLIGTELVLCQRYYENIAGGITTYNATSSAAKAVVNMLVPKRGTMSIGLISGTTWYFQSMASTFASGSNGYVGTGIYTGPTSITQYGGSVNSQVILFDLVAPSTLPTGMGYMFFGSNNLNSALTGVGMYVSSEL